MPGTQPLEIRIQCGAECDAVNQPAFRGILLVDVFSAFVESLDQAPAEIRRLAADRQCSRTWVRGHESGRGAVVNPRQYIPNRSWLSTKPYRVQHLLSAGVDKIELVPGDIFETGRGSHAKHKIGDYLAGALQFAPSERVGEIRKRDQRPAGAFETVAGIIEKTYPIAIGFGRFPPSKRFLDETCPVGVLNTCCRDPSSFWGGSLDALRVYHLDAFRGSDRSQIAHLVDGGRHQQPDRPQRAE
ncbi:hypothetical protein CK230_21930 [Mesorhizobium sp. WSM3859]|nr:hypothetical protein CK230_21930 [Mesorhizobium sp. WSM3859]